MRWGQRHYGSETDETGQDVAGNMDIEIITGQYADIIENDLREVVPQAGAFSGPLDEFYAMFRYHLGWTSPNGENPGGFGGKRIRPVLCLLACEAAGGDYSRALPIATSIELLHNFTLIHDDIQDRSGERRHRPTVWKIWGEAQAINSGDGMYALGLLALLRLAEKGVKATFINEATIDINRTLLALSEGQFLDISFEKRLDVTIDEYLSMIERKTAALIGSALYLGAYVATNNAAMAEYYREFGRGLGIAFQIQDDILGIWGDPQTTGKPAGDDILQKKKTLPFVFAVETAGPDQKQRLLDIYGAPAVSESQVREATGILDRLGARAFAESQAKAWYESALTQLDNAKPTREAGLKLRTLAEALLNRSR